MGCDTNFYDPHHMASPAVLFTAGLFLATMPLQSFKEPRLCHIIIYNSITWKARWPPRQRRPPGQLTLRSNLPFSSAEAF